MRLVERTWQALPMFFPGRPQSIALLESREVLHGRHVLRVEWALPVKVAVDDGRRAGPEILAGEHRQRQG